MRDRNYLLEIEWNGGWIVSICQYRSRNENLKWALRFKGKLKKSSTGDEEEREKKRLSPTVPAYFQCTC